VAAESGEQRAARLRAAADRDPARREGRLAAATRIEQGNVGERRVAQLLDVLDGAGWVVLHDRYKSATSPANLDHIAVGPPGVFVIDSKNWTGGRLRYDDRGMALGRYRRDDELHSAKVDADIVRRIAGAAVHDIPVLGVLAFVEDVALPVPVHHQQVVLLQAEQLLSWLTAQPARLTPAEVHQVGSTLDTALPPRGGLRRPFVLPAGTDPCPAPARGPSGATPPRRPRPSGGPAARRRGSRRPARTAGQELAYGLRRLVAFLALAAVMLFVAVPIASRVLPPLLTRLVQTAVPTPTPVRPTLAPAPPTNTCASAPASVPPGCSPR